VNFELVVAQFWLSEVVIGKKQQKHIRRTFRNGCNKSRTIKVL